MTNQHNAGPSGRINVNHVSGEDALAMQLGYLERGRSMSPLSKRYIREHEYRETRVAIFREWNRLDEEERNNSNPHSDCLAVLDDIVEAGDVR